MLWPFPTLACMSALRPTKAPIAAPTPAARPHPKARPRREPTLLPPAPAGSLRISEDFMELNIRDRLAFCTVAASAVAVEQRRGLDALATWNSAFSLVYDGVAAAPRCKPNRQTRTGR